MADLLPIGTRAPDFSLPATSGDTIALRDYAGRKHVVLVFYVGDNTPDWNRQLSSLRDDAPELDALDIIILGINPASPEDHTQYSGQLSLNFSLLSDTEGRVAALYGARNSDRLIQRSVYVVDKAGSIRFVARGMHWTPDFYETLAGLE